MTLARIRTGDTVIVISGKDKGKTGRVLRVWPDLERVTVEKINMIKRHTKPTPTRREGGIIEREQPFHVSKVMPFDAETGMGMRVRTRVEPDRSKTRLGVLSRAARAKLAGQGTDKQGDRVIETPRQP